MGTLGEVVGCLDIRGGEDSAATVSAGAELAKAARGEREPWFSKRAEHCRVAKNFGCEPFRRKPISREGRSTIAGRTPPWTADAVQECGRLEATAEEFFGVQMLVQGSDDGNVEGNGMPRLSSTNWRDQLGC